MFSHPLVTIVAMSFCVGVLFPGLTCKANTATYYWVAGGNGLWSSNTNWAATSGGAGGAGVPGSASNTVDSTSGRSGGSLVDAGFINSIHSLTLVAGYTGTISLAASLNLTGTSPFFSQAAPEPSMKPTTPVAADAANLTGLSGGQIAATGGTFRGPDKPSGAAGSTTPVTRIASATDLKTIYIAANLGKAYVQTRTIDLSGVSDFTPYIIGNGTDNFTGSYDGYGYAISGLTILGSNSNVGFFGVTSSTAVITGVGLTSVNIHGGGLVGGLVGYNFGSLSNSYVTGNVTGSSIDVAGLVGLNSGTITNSYYGAGTVTGLGNSCGGLVGGNSGTVSYSYATGNVIGGGSKQVGGLVGFNNGGTISHSHATGNVSSSTSYRVGGLVGYNSGAVTYAIPIMLAGL